MENKQDIVQLIYRSMWGTLTPDEQARLDSYRRESEAHERLYRRLTDAAYLQQEFRKRGQVQVDRPLRAMQRRIDRENNRLWQWVGKAAAAVAIALGGYYIGLQSGQDKPSVPVQTATVQATQPAIRPGSMQANLTLPNGNTLKLNSNEQHNTIALASARKQVEQRQQPKTKLNKLATPKGGEFKIVLEDSTVVWLNSESQLHYPEHFGEKERRVRLVGEAYFKVHPDSDRPFYVESGEQMVRVYGTEFNINYYDENEAIYTTLINGKIAIGKTGDSEAALVLSPGHQAVFEKSSAVATIRSVDTQTVASWKDGMFVFEEQNLEQIMYTLGRWYDFTFEFADEAARHIVFMGRIARSSDFAGVLEILEKSGGLKFSVEGNHLKISSKPS